MVHRLNARLAGVYLAAAATRLHSSDPSGAQEMVDEASLCSGGLPTEPEAFREVRRSIEGARADIARERTRRDLTIVRRAEIRTRLLAAPEPAGTTTQGGDRSPGLALALSSVLPGVGQLTDRRPLPALGFFLGTAIPAVAGVLLVRAADSQYANYQNATDGQRAADLYSSTHTLWISGVVAFSVAGAAWLWNVIDAYGGRAMYQ